MLDSLSSPVDGGNPFRYTRNPLQAFCFASPKPLKFQRSWDLRTNPGHVTKPTGAASFTPVRAMTQPPPFLVGTLSTPATNRPSTAEQSATRRRCPQSPQHCQPELRSTTTTFLILGPQPDAAPADADRHPTRLQPPPSHPQHPTTAARTLPNTTGEQHPSRMPKQGRRLLSGRQHQGGSSRQRQRSRCVPRCRAVACRRPPTCARLRSLLGGPLRCASWRWPTPRRSSRT